MNKNSKIIITLLLFISFFSNSNADNTSAINLSCSGNTKCIQAESLINSMRAKWGGGTFNRKLLDPQTMVYGNSYRIKNVKNERDLIIAQFQTEVLGLYPNSIPGINKLNKNNGLLSKMTEQQ